MKPGATTRPLASISRFVGAAGTRPTATIRSPRMAHVAVEPGIAGAIDDLAVAYDEVVGGGRLFGIQTGGGEEYRREKKENGGDFHGSQS